MENILQPLFACRCGGEEISVKLGGEPVALPGGLQVRADLRALPGGLYWQPVIANLGQATSLPVSQLRTGCVAALEGPVTLFTTRGTWGPDLEKDFFIESQPLNAPKVLSCAHGRSSEGLMPYFDLNAGGRGVLAAVGWSGQWSVSLSPCAGGVMLEAGLPEADFVLYPGEEYVLPSLLILPYRQGQTNAHNAFRRLLKEHFMPVGKGERPKELPLSIMHWGFTPSDVMCKMARQYKEAGVNADIFWVDAGWFGTPDLQDWMSFVGHTGNWTPDARTHPDGLREVAKTAREQGMGFLLWFEPERMASIQQAAKEHPDWFLPLRTPEDKAQPVRNFLLNLGCPGGYGFMLEILQKAVLELNLAWLRIDYNIHPLEHWRQNDAPGRTGINEIAYVNGLYRLLAELNERFPRLLIDNCASGGSRLDMEMMKYSVPLWRSDYQCNAECNPDANQSHMMGGAWWLPLHGTGMGTHLEDIYRFRSTYSSAAAQELLVPCNGVAAYQEEKEPEYRSKMAVVAKLNAEYRSLRAFFEEDYYPLTPQSTDLTTWAAWQFFNPKTEEGLVQVFRREKSRMTEAQFCLGGLQDWTTYRLTDVDTGLQTEYAGKELMAGWRVRMDTPRLAKIWRIEKL